ncbi:MAG: response regulator [Gemmatimonadales bacterium]|jgi:DNA-binding NtrC family response regulator
MTRILVVDDEPALRRTLERALCSLKYDVVAIGDAHLAYQMLDAGEYDLVLLDIHLQQMSGDTFFLALVRRWPRLAGRVILMTGDPWAVKADWPADLRRCPVLSKPFTLDVLSTSICSALTAAEEGGQQRKRNGG